MVKLQPLAGIYIHIPFCHQACTYCNFHFSTSLEKKGLFLSALEKEIRLRAPGVQGQVFDTLYLGGGTPSILSGEELKLLLQQLSESLAFTELAEITLEANPEDISAASVRTWKELGINRLSVGIQSFDDEELSWMNRKHRKDDAIRCVENIRTGGIENFSVDLIYGSPMLTDDRLNESLDFLIGQGVPHLSCYALTVEPKTRLEKMIRDRKTPTTDQDKQARQFLLIMHRLREAGYEHYEISNYALPGMRSRHNSNYWMGVPYTGLGPSAHSFDGYRTRSWNVANNSLYIQAIERGELPQESETLTDKDLLNEYIMTTLRTPEGIDTKIVSEKYSSAAANTLIQASVKYTSTKKMMIRDGCLLLTDEGKLYADGIASDLFF